MKLKECPHCGCEEPWSNSKRHIYIHPVTGKEIDQGFRVWCPKCGAYGPSGNTKREAEKLWNMRKTS